MFDLLFVSTDSAEERSHQRGRMLDILKKILAVVLFRFVGECRDRERAKCEGCAQDWPSQRDHACMDFGWTRDNFYHLGTHGSEARHSINHLSIVGAFYLAVIEQGLNIALFTQTDARHEIARILHSWFEEGVDEDEILKWIKTDDPVTERVIHYFDIDHYRLIYQLD